MKTAEHPHAQTARISPIDQLVERGSGCQYRIRFAVDGSPKTYPKADRGRTILWLSISACLQRACYGWISTRHFHAVFTSRPTHPHSRKPNRVQCGPPTHLEEDRYVARRCRQGSRADVHRTPASIGRCWL